MDDIPDLVRELPDDFTTKPLYLATIEDTSAYAAKPETNSKIPITIVTGYLGSGKSTLLDMIGRKSKKRLAIILNEFGDTAAIEKSVTIKDSQEAVQEWLDLGNGCLCCTVKDNGVTAIENLIEKSKDKIDYILLETTGVADPAPIAKMFWLDDALASSVYIDGVVTVVDACNILTCLDDVGGHWHRANNHMLTAQSDLDLTPEEVEKEKKLLEEGMTTAHLQLALADTILVNKIDRIHDAGSLQKIYERIRQINSSSPLHTTSFGDIDLDKILDMHAFEATAKLAGLVSVVTGSSYHDDRITTVSLDFPFFDSPLGFAQVDRFLQHILWQDEANGKGIEVHRCKGILVCGADVRVIQGVRDTYEILEGGVLHEDIKNNKIVLIGKRLAQEDLTIEMSKFVN